MTRDDIFNMEAGRELDFKIIKKLDFKLKRMDDLGNWVQLSIYEDPVLFRPSQNISDAWQVVEKLKENYICKILGLTIHKNWFCSFTPIDGSGYSNYSYSESLPFAICKASLLTILYGGE